MKILPTKKDLVRALVIFCLDSIINAPFIGILALATVVIRSITSLFCIFCKKPYAYVPLLGFMLLLFLEIRFVLYWKEMQSQRHKRYDIEFALNHYKDKEGLYPQSLHELVPHYLEKMPRSKMGLFLGTSQFGYQRIEPNELHPKGGFLLTYHETFWHQKIWDEKNSQWKDLYEVTN